MDEGRYKMSTLDYLFQGFGTALIWYNIIFAFVGVLIGTAVGVLPGIGPMSGVALLIPVTASITGGLLLNKRQRVRLFYLLVSIMGRCMGDRQLPFY